MDAIRITEQASLDRLATSLRVVLDAIEKGSAWAVSVGVDTDIDQGARFKLNDGPWGPPCYGEARK